MDFNSSLPTLIIAFFTLSSVQSQKYFNFDSSKIFGSKPDNNFIAISSTERPLDIIAVTEGNPSIFFSIVDINHMCFGKVNIKKGCKNFERLWGKTELFKIIAKEYANVRGYNEKDCIELVIQYRNKFWKKYALHHEVGFSLD